MKNSKGIGAIPLYEDNSTTHPFRYFPANNSAIFSDFENSIIKLHRFFEDHANHPLLYSLYLRFSVEEIDEFIAKELIYIVGKKLTRSKKLSHATNQLSDQAYEFFHTVSDRFDCNNSQHLSYARDILMLQLGTKPVFRHIFQGEHQFLPHIREIKFELERINSEEFVKATIVQDFGVVRAGTFDCVSDVFQNENAAIYLTFSKVLTSNNDLVIYIDNLDLENSENLPDSHKILMHLVDYFRQMAKNSSARKLYIQYDSLSSKIISVLKSQYSYIGRYPMIPRGLARSTHEDKDLSIFDEDYQRDIKNLTFEVDINTPPLGYNIFTQLNLKKRDQTH